MHIYLIARNIIVASYYLLHTCLFIIAFMHYLFISYLIHAFYFGALAFILWLFCDCFVIISFVLAIIFVAIFLVSLLFPFGLCFHNQINKDFHKN
jgi:hypothetical protein